jgi:hypothetical protein
MINLGGFDRSGKGFDMIFNNFLTPTAVMQKKLNPSSDMKNADRPFLLLIFVAITLLYTVMAFIS